MKKFVSRILAVVVLAVTMFLAGCENTEILHINQNIGGFSYHWVHIPYNDACFRVKSLLEVSTGIRVQTEEYGWMFFAEGTYILVSNESECPICTELEGI